MFSSRLIIVPIILLFPALLWASQVPSEAGIDWLKLFMGLFGGLALFLAGLEVLSTGLKLAAGNTLRTVLQKLTVNRFLGVITGAFVTGILNSSSVTTVLVVGFVTAGVMSLSQSIGIIMGANIGSTVTAQILAFNVAAFALIPVAIGFFMFFASKAEGVKHSGMMIMGLGLVFYGMGLMSEGMTPLRSYEPFMEILVKMENPLFGILAGAVFTGLVQSSAATVGIAIAMASEGLLSLPAGIALALGANVGTCVTAALAALGKPVEAVRAAVVHVAFNILGVLIWLPFLGILADMAVSVSPVAVALDGTAALAEEVPRQIANANTMFNVINTFLFIAFTTWFARMAEWLVPEKAPTEGVIIEPVFLDDAALEVPAVALENARQEIHRAGLIALEMMDEFKLAITQRDTKKLEELARSDDQIDILEAEIMTYLAHIRQSVLSEDESREHHTLVTILTNLESLADIIETEMVAVSKAFIEGDFQPNSEETYAMLKGLWTRVYQALELAVQAVGKNDQVSAQNVLLMSGEVRDLADSLFERQSSRLHAEDPKYLQKVRLLLTFIEQLRHIYTLTKRMARPCLPVEVTHTEN